MMLYKTRGFYGGSAITRTYCPLNGRFKFTYSINDGTEDDLECHEPVSEAGDCPSGYKFDLHFRGCSFPNFGKFNQNTLLFIDFCTFIFLNFDGSNPPNDKCFFCSLFRHELPVFGVLGRWKRRDVHELARHKTTSTWRRGQTKISLCGESAHFLLSKLKNKTFVYKVLTTLFEDNVHRILRGSHFLQIPWRFQNDQIWFPYLKKFE